ncbi:Alpha/Beta hydrolase protein [Phycomyces nitens]|nr:Alpha/Beta hydrolase protein [Phycomyces nitens]
MTGADQVQVIDEWSKTKDGHDIFTKTWKPVGEPVAQILMIHGFGEHIARYDEMFTFYAENGIESFGFDQRGWGETGAKSKEFGNNNGYMTALGDINAKIHKLKRPEVPLFLIGHSMGGGLVLNLLVRKDVFDGVGLLQGVISSAPLVTLTTPVHPIKFIPLSMLSKVLPSFVIRAGLDPNGISQDKEQVKKYLADPLIHDYATLDTLRGFLEAGESLLTEGVKIDTPILFSHGTADPINNHDSTKKVYEIASSKDKEMKSWPGLYHELHNELVLERKNVIEYYLHWIQARIPTKSTK